MSSLDEMTLSGAMSMLASRLPTGVSACEYQLAFDADTSTPVVRVVMILTEQAWSDEASEACVAASTAAWEVLPSHGYMPDVICRTASEHESARGNERWVKTGVDC